MGALSRDVRGPVRPSESERETVPVNRQGVQRQRRISYRLGRRPALDGVRGLAVLAVVVGHVLPTGSSNAGTVGVNAFFTLSGFLITRLLIEERLVTGGIRLRSFYVRRWRRLVPAAAAFLLVATVLLTMEGASRLPVIWSALSVANFANLAQQPMAGLAHMWSLSMEEQFYLAWPPVLALLLRHRRLLVPAIAAAVVLSAAVLGYLALTGASSQRVMFGPDSRASAILIGCLLACLMEKLSHLPFRGPLAAVGAITLLSCMTPMMQASWTLLPTALGAFFLVLWAASVPSSTALRALSWPPLVGAGKISYGIYLWHMPFALAFSSTLPFSEALILTLVTSIGIALASYGLLERPNQRPRARMDTLRDPKGSVRRAGLRVRSSPGAPQRG